MVSQLKDMFHNNLIKQTNCRKVAITGAMASGKSYFSKQLAINKKCFYFSVDNFVSKIYSQSPFDKKEIISRLLSSGKVEQQRILKQLSKYFRPLILSEIHNICRKNIGKTVIFEVPTLFESCMELLFDKIILIDTPKFKRKWFSNKRNQNIPLMKILESNQKPQEQKRHKSNLILKNAKAKSSNI
jgi:dephospho-CoA kinase